MCSYRGVVARSLRHYEAFSSKLREISNLPGPVPGAASRPLPDERLREGLKMSLVIWLYVACATSGVASRSFLISVINTFLYAIRATSFRVSLFREVLEVFIFSAPSSSVSRPAVSSSMGVWSDAPLYCPSIFTSTVPPLTLVRTKSGELDTRLPRA